MNYKYLLKQFRDLKINRDELKEHGGEYLLNKNVDVVSVCNIHLINILKKYVDGSVSQDHILEWVNTIWFSDLYDYCAEGCECVASIMNKLEEIDEGFIFNKLVAEKFISALEKNIIL